MIIPHDKVSDGLKRRIGHRYCLILANVSNSSSLNTANAQSLGFFQFTACGFSGDNVVGFFGYAAGNFTACGLDQGLGLVAFERG